MSAQSITVRIFVSSTWLDLQPEREAVETALQRLRETKFVGMEYFGSRDESTRRASLDEVDRSQVYVGIFGGRYGSGITEAEYRRARERDLPCFIYFKDAVSIPPEGRETDPDKAAQLAALKEELRRSHTVTTFTTPDDLKVGVTADLHRWLFDEYLLPTLERVSLLGDEANIRRLTEAVRDKEALRTVLAQRGIAVGEDVVQSLLVTGNHNVINFLVQGITALPTDYASRVQNFLIEYLGTPDRPVPFGGREADLAHLGNWLDDPQTSPYLLLAASAGRGKSALLARWSWRLLARRDLAVVFIPVSVRFRTNLAGVVFAALAARLAQLHGEQVPSGVDTPAEVWRGMVTNYLARPLPEGRRLLLILDGVDEAADWEVGPDLFPLAPPPGLRIVVSARYLAGDTSAIDWLRRLGWEHRGLAQASDLDPLTREGVADVLRRMRFPLDQLGAQVDIVAELHRLSEGDPLLVRLHVDDLWERGEAAARLHPENLRVIRPGLKGYFERWWEDQHRLWGDSAPLRERAVQIVLNLLACALGPLSQEDVLRLAPPESELNTWTLEQALRPLARFVIGDGHQQGYVFSHPRLGAYFYEKLTDGERHTWEARFLTWGEKTLAALEVGQQEPEEAPPYLVQYYGAHLERAKVMPERLLALVSNGWRRAWEVLEGSYAGFLNDVERAWRAAERANMMAAQAGKLAPHLGSEVRCALCLASVRSLAQNVPPTLLTTLVGQGVWTPAQGLAYARQVPEPVQRAWALVELVPLLSEPLTGDALREALDTARAIEDEDERAEALVELAPHLPKPLLREALDTVQAIRDKFERVVVLAGLMPHLPEPLESDALREALDTVQAIRDKFERVVVLAGLMPHLPEPLKSNVLREALDTARAIEDEDERAEALAELAPYLPRPLLHEALGVARAIVSEYERAEALAALVPLLPEPLKSDVLREALNAAWATRNVNNRTAALAVLIPFLPEPLKSDAMREALNTAWMNVSEHMLAKALAKLAPLLPEPLKSDELREALEAVRTIEDEDRRTWALAALIPHLPEPLKSDAVREAMNVARTIEGRYQRLEALAELAACLPKPLLQEALDIARVIEDKRYWSRALVRLAPRLAELGYPQEALDTARMIEDEYRRTKALAALIPHLPEPLKSNALREAMEAARVTEDKQFWAWVIGSEHLQAEVLVALAPHLPELLLREVLDTAQAIRSEHLRAEVLVALAPHLPELLLREALNTVRAIEDEDERAWALARLAPRLVELGHPEKALAMARAIEKANDRMEALTALAPHLPEPLKSDVLREALEAVQSIGSEYMRARALARLAPHLTQLLLREALDAAWAIKDADERARALMALVPHLPEPLKSDVLREALEAARAIRSEHMRVEALIALVPRLPEPLKSDALCETLDAARVIEDGYWWVEALAKLAPRLVELSHPEEALAMARAIGNKDQRTEVLVALAPHLPEPLKSDVLREALDAAWTITYGYRRAEALAALFSHLPEPLLRKALDTAWTIEWDLDQVWALAELAPHLSEAERLAVLREALDIARVIEDEDRRTWALAKLAPHLPEPLKSDALREAMEAARAIEDADKRAEALAELAPHLAQLPPTTLYPLWRESLHHLATRIRSDLLTDLVELHPVIIALGRVEALIETAHAIQDVGRWWP